MWSSLWPPAEIMYAARSYFFTLNPVVPSEQSKRRLIFNLMSNISALFIISHSNLLRGESPPAIQLHALHHFASSKGVQCVGRSLDQYVDEERRDNLVRTDAHKAHTWVNGKKIYLLLDSGYVLHSWRCVLCLWATSSPQQQCPLDHRIYIMNVLSETKLRYVREMAVNIAFPL